MSLDDPFGAPRNPSPGFDPSPSGYEALASGDESVLAASGLNARPPGPRNKGALIALGLALLVGGIGIAIAAGVFRSRDSKPAAGISAKPQSSPPTLDLPTTDPPATPKPKPKPATPKPTAAKPVVGTVKSITKVNSGTLGQGYTVTVPKAWTVGTGISKDRTANVDVRMRSADKSQTFVMATIAPAIASGRLTPATLAAIRAALLKSDAAAKALPGTPRAQVAGAAATGYDVSTTGSGKPITTRTLVWVRGTTIYAATWRVPAATFARSLPTFNSILAAVKYPA